MKEKIESLLKNAKRTEILAASLCLILTATITVTLAYLKSETKPVENTFELVEVPNEVIETLDQGAKKDVKIKNTSESEPAYIRVKVVATWVKLDGNNKVIETYGSLPTECDCQGNCIDTTCEQGCGYVVTWRPDMDNNTAGTQNDWVKGEDGYYYFKSRVEAGATTDILFTDCKVAPCADIPEGYHLSIEIMGQSIQANGKDGEGKTPVELAWGREAAKLVGAIIEEGGNR